MYYLLLVKFVFLFFESAVDAKKSEIYCARVHTRPYMSLKC